MTNHPNTTNLSDARKGVSDDVGFPIITNPAELPPRYIMICRGDCMAPVANDGDHLGFERDEPVERGDLVALFLRPELVAPGKPQVWVKRLVLARQRLPPRQWHPPLSPHPLSAPIPQ